MEIITHRRVEFVGTNGHAQQVELDPRVNIAIERRRLRRERAYSLAFFAGKHERAQIHLAALMIMPAPRVEGDEKKKREAKLRWADRLVRDQEKLGRDHATRWLQNAPETEWDRYFEDYLDRSGMRPAQLESREVPNNLPIPRVATVYRNGANEAYSLAEDRRGYVDPEIEVDAADRWQAKYL